MFLAIRVSICIILTTKIDICIFQALFSGAAWTKIGLFFIDVENPCDPRNILLLAMYKGDDTSPSMSKYCSDIFNQLSNIQGSTYPFAGDEVTIMLLLGGDMSYQANVIGRPHVWSFNDFCMKCYANKRNNHEAQSKSENRDFQVNRPKMSRILFLVLRNRIRTKISNSKTLPATASATSYDCTKSTAPYARFGERFFKSFGKIGNYYRPANLR